VSALLADLDDDALSALADRVVHGVIPVLAVLDPELVVLGGPTGAAGGERLAELVAQRLGGVGSRRLARLVALAPPGARDRNRGPSVLGGARRMLVGRIHDRPVADISNALIKPKDTP